MRAFCSVVLAAASLALAGPVLAQAPDPMVRTEGLKQVSPHVHVIPDNSVPMVPNVGLVVGERGILVIDTGMGPRNGVAVAQVAQKLGGSRALYLVTTHFHPEHDLGASAFPASTTLIRSADQIKDIEEFGLQLAKVFASRSQFIADLLKDADFRKADVTFEKDYMLDLGGGVRAQIIAMGPNHTRGDTAVWVESDRVLFSGDVVMQRQPAFASPYSRIGQWLTSLDRLDAFKPSLVVPSHGPTGDAAFIANYRAYLIEVRDRTTTEKKAGKTAEQATEAVSAAMTDRYPDQGRLTAAIRAAGAEAP